MVKAVINGRTTAYISPIYQIANPGTTGQKVTKFYAGGAMRVGGVVYYTLSDHIGSTSITLNDSGAKTAEMRYKAWGEVRYDSGDLQTDRTYTGQRTYTDDFGLMFYNARWYDSQIGRFAQADNIPLQVGSIETLDRFTYVLNNPIMHSDPTGHCVVGGHDLPDSNPACKTPPSKNGEGTTNDNPTNYSHDGGSGCRYKGNNCPALKHYYETSRGSGTCSSALNTSQCSWNVYMPAYIPEYRFENGPDMDDFMDDAIENLGVEEAKAFGAIDTIAGLPDLFAFGPSPSTVLEPAYNSLNTMSLANFQDKLDDATKTESFFHGGAFVNLDGMSTLTIDPVGNALYARIATISIRTLKTDQTFSVNVMGDDAKMIMQYFSANFSTADIP